MLKFSEQVSGTILVVGATGNVGKHVVKELTKQGKQVRILTREIVRAHELFGSGLEIVAGDLNDPATITTALAGVSKAYLATNGGDQVVMETNFIQAASDTGLEQLVKVSLINSRPDTFITLARVHAEIETRLITSGIPATILRANYFMENFLATAATIASQGAIYGSAGDGKVGFIAGRDIAAVAVEALTNSAHTGQSYNLTGPQALTFSEAAEQIGRGIGREVAYINLSDDDFALAMTGAGMSNELVQIYLQGQQAVRLGTYAEITGTVKTLTGQEPLKLEEFVRQYANSFLAVGAR